MKAFASDNYASAHPDVLAAMAQANDGHAVSYGADPWTARALEVLRGHFGEQSQSLLVFNGSGANVARSAPVCRPWEAVICADTAHVNVDEGGAPERDRRSQAPHRRHARRQAHARRRARASDARG